MALFLDYDEIFGRVVKLLDTEATFELSPASRRCDVTVHTHREVLDIGCCLRLETEWAALRGDTATVPASRAPLRGLASKARSLTYLDVSGLPCIDDAALAAFAPKMAIARSPASASAADLLPGCHVRLTGLRAAPGLNGQLGICREWMAAAGRWAVEMRDRSWKKVKPENLEVVRRWAVGLPDAAASASVDISGCTRVTAAGLLAMTGRGIVVKTKRCWRLHSPSIDLGPREVVEQQLLALGAARREEDFLEGVRKCFEYASPANKNATGPAERFGRMIQQGYASMIYWRSFVVETSDEDGFPDGRANIVVRLHPAPGSPSKGMQQTFCWILSLQAGPEHAGCWMTDSVV